MNDIVYTNANVFLFCADAFKKAQDAYAASIEKSPKTADGFVRDVCGGAFVQIYKPNRKLLNRLKAVNAVQRGSHPGYWIFHSAPCNEQALCVEEAGANAQCDALRIAFPGEDISVHTWID